MSEDAATAGPMSVPRDEVWPTLIDTEDEKGAAEMATLLTEVFELTEDESREAARSALASGGYTFKQLADQAGRGQFETLHARLTWEAVRYVGEPDAS